MKPAEYFQRTRDLTTAYFFVAPVLAFYEIGILLLGVDVRNGADVLLRSLFGLFGETAVIAFNLLLLLFAVFAGIQLVKRDQPVFVLLAPVVVESAIYSIFFAPAVLLLETRILQYLGPDGGQEVFLHVVLSAGAGVYEEILFRLILVTSILFLFERMVRLKKGVAMVLAVLISATLFSAFHHIGTYGEPFAMHPFLFRLVAGLLLSAIYLARGLAVAVYTHTFYDVLVYLQQGA